MTDHSQFGIFAVVFTANKWVVPHLLFVVLRSCRGYFFD